MSRARVAKEDKEAAEAARIKRAGQYYQARREEALATRLEAALAFAASRVAPSGWTTRVVY